MQGNSTRRCSICLEHLPTDRFYMLLNRNGKRYPNSYCKSCGNKKRREYNQSQRPGPNAIRVRNLRVYGLTVEQYDAMVIAQGGVCAICHCPESHVSSFTKKIRRLSVDHDHKTKKIRGLLCSACNRSIGLLGDDLERLRAVLSYLEKSSQP